MAKVANAKDYRPLINTIVDLAFREAHAALDKAKEEVNRSLEDLLDQMEGEEDGPESST